jgi:O-antigen/teichoic acid export membrane protein
VGIIQKQSLTGVIWSYVGVGLGFLTTAILFTQFLETEEIGLLRLLVSYASILAMFSSLGITNVTVRMFPYFRNEQQKHHGFLGLALIVVIAGFVLSSIVYILLKNVLLAGAEEKSALLIPFFYAVVPLTFFNVLFGVLDAYFRVLYDAVKGIAYKEVVQRILIIGAIFLYYFQIIGFTFFVWLYILAYLAPALFFISSLARQKKLFLNPDIGFLSKPLRKEMACVGFFGILASFSGILVQSIDSIMIDRFLGLSSVGVYTISFFFGTLILIPQRSMSKIGSVVIADAWKKNDLKTISDIYTKSSLTLSVIGLLFFIGIWGNIENVFSLIGDNYIEGRYVILFISIANVLEVSTGLSNHIIINSKHYKWQTYLLVVFACFIVVTNWIFIPLYGITGAALATLLSKLIYNLLRILFIRLKFNIQPFVYKHLILFLIAFAAWYLSTFIPAFSNYFIDIVVRSSLLTAAFLLPVYFAKISDDINREARKGLQQISNIFR